VGADDSLFAPSLDPPRPRPLRVLYVGNYVPLHGAPIILQAARLLDGEEIEFWLIGENHLEAPVLKDLLRNSDSKRVKFYPWMPPQELRAKIAEADVCLGIFGTSDKAKRVIPGKAFLALAMGKPLITGDSPAARQLLEDGKNVILCEMGSSDALVDAIRRLQRDPVLRQRIGEEGRKLFQNQCRPKVLGLRLAHLIQETLNRKEIRGY
jgi:glycosyltransferase involved in cell wall biosynthesis